MSFTLLILIIICFIRSAKKMCIILYIVAWILGYVYKMQAIDYAICFHLYVKKVILFFL